MNERIKELAKQATRIEEPDGLFPREEFDREKFAELIVRECADLVKNFYQEDEFTCYSAETEIKQHFGVEE